MLTDDDWDELIEAASGLPLPEVLVLVEAALGVGTSVELWLWDYQRRSVVEVRSGRTLARSDIATELLDAATHRQVRVQGEALGMLAVLGSTATPRCLDRLAHLLAIAVRASETTTDTVAQRRRTKPMSLPAEMQWRILPPSQFGLPGIELSASVEPAYDTGGDIFDYALTGESLFLGVLDARGHGLRAATTATVAASAMRRARRSGDGLLGIAEEIAASVGAIGADHDFVSAVLMTVELSTGQGQWLSAGHLPPLLVGTDAVALDLQPALPLGIVLQGQPSEPVIQPFELEPGRSLALYSDGIVENAAEADGLAVGEERFQRALVERIADAHGGENVARKVIEDLLAITGPTLRDDATLMIVSRSER